MSDKIRFRRIYTVIGKTEEYTLEELSKIYEIETRGVPVYNLLQKISEIDMPHVEDSIIFSLEDEEAEVRMTLEVVPEIEEK